MLALFYSVRPIGWGTCKWLRHVWPGCLVTGLNGLRLRHVEPPRLPGQDWVRVRTLLGGVCGTDLAVIAQKQPPNSILQAFSSFPAVLGHENVAVVEAIGDAVDSSWRGRRVCVEPTLCCAVRGIDPPCPRCRQGQFGACERFGSDGEGTAALPKGSSIGFNARTGGSFGEFFVAHVSQLVPVPDALTDEQAVLTDPVACSLHAAMRAHLAGTERVLIYGAGVLGLSLVAVLRAIGYEGVIDALDRGDYIGPLARQLGCSRFLRLPRGKRARFEAIADRTGGTVHRARFGNYTISGGYDVTFDCVGTPRSFNECLTWTRSRGQVVMIATGHGGRIRLTPVWFTELTITGAYGRQVESFRGRRIGTYQLTHELMAEGKLNVDGLLTHTFRLAEYKQALTTGMNKQAHRAVKVAFDFR